MLIRPHDASKQRMMMDLLAITEGGAASCKSIWVDASPGEAAKGAPAKRIIHARTIQLQEKATLDRIGIRVGPGYQKCGSQKELDWAQDIVVLVQQERAGDWTSIFEQIGVQEPVGITWFSLGGAEAESIIIQIRKSGIDRWWPSWNVAMNSLILEGTYTPPMEPVPVRHLNELDYAESDIPSGVLVESRGHEIRFRTDYFDIGFARRNPELTFLAIDEMGQGKACQNLLKLASQHRKNDATTPYLVQGPRMYPWYPPIAGFFQFEPVGITVEGGNRVKYWCRSDDAGVEYQFQWDIIGASSFSVTIQRTCKQRIRMLHSGWQFSLDSKAAPVTALGAITKQGETGLLEFPVILHFPGKGTLLCTLEKGICLARFDANPPAMTNTFELKMGEEPQPEGDYLLPEGHAEATVKFEVITPEFAALRDDAPQVVKDMVRFRAVTALTYRADTATFSNNGTSMHCPACIDSWAENVIGFTPWQGIEPRMFLQQTLERWLLEAPAYGSGRSIIDDNHYYEDEYIICGTSALFGLAKFLQAYNDEAWFEQYKENILVQVTRMQGRDVDGDGIVESTYRLGISGEHQWSTNWWDVLSFGWKDAFSNAFLYPALVTLSKVFTEHGMADEAANLDTWASNLKQNFVPTFFNEKTGWLAGWRCKEDKLHDYAFLFVNGAAVEYGLVDGDLAMDIMERLWNELQASRFRDYNLGLPGNLWYIPASDTAKPQYGEPMGTYENGGATHSQSRHFVSGLYAAGMTVEGDMLLEQLSQSMADGSAFGGVGSGVDWRTWDGRPCGYEGLLCDQFGILVPALHRWSRKDSR